MKIWTKCPTPENTEKSPRTDREIIKKRLQNHQEMTENVWEIFMKKALLTSLNRIYY